MNSATKWLLVGSIILTTGCATGLNTIQEREYSAMQSENLLVEEKSPTTCAWFGLLPGGGSFCARSPGLGIVNLLFWPLSIMWDPVSGYDGAKAINYDISKHQVKVKKAKEMDELDGKLSTGEIDSKQYSIEKHKIDAKYDFE